MMKKLFLALVLCLSMIPSICMAVEPEITSDTRTFNPISGVYDLRGNVFVRFPAHDTMLVITGDATQVNIYKMEVHGQGNINLSYADLKFKCDTVDVYHKDSTAYVAGNTTFANDNTTITADSGSFNWKTKLAKFEGNVKVNGESRGPVTYNVITKTFE